jgi:hypothetical protein
MAVSCCIERAPRWVVFNATADSGGPAIAGDQFGVGERRTPASSHVGGMAIADRVERAPSWGVFDATADAGGPPISGNPFVVGSAPQRACIRGRRVTGMGVRIRVSC